MSELHFIGKDGQTRRVGKCSNLEITPEPTLRGEIGELPGVTFTREPAVIRGTFQLGALPHMDWAGLLARTPRQEQSGTITFTSVEKRLRELSEFDDARYQRLRVVALHNVFLRPRWPCVPMNRRDRMRAKRARGTRRGKFSVRIECRSERAP